MTTPVVRRVLRRPRTGWGRRVSCGALLLALFLGVFSTTAVASGEGSFRDWRTRNFWGHVIHANPSDCMWENWALWWDGQGQAGPKLYTYGSVDGSIPNRDGGVDNSCKLTSKELLNTHIQVAQHLGHWIEEFNTWVWCNNGPWIANWEPDGWDHDAATSFTWQDPPCLDQGPNFNNFWYIGYHEQWHGPNRSGGTTGVVPVFDDWLWVTH